MDSIDVLLSEVCRLHHTRARSAMHSLGLHRGQPRLLRILWEQEGRTHTELAERLYVQPATITRMVQRLERAGFVQRRPDHHDERVSRVHLTERGRRIRGEVQDRLREIDAGAIAGLTDAETRALADLLGRVRDNLLTRVAADRETES